MTTQISNLNVITAGILACSIAAAPVAMAGKVEQEEGWQEIAGKLSKKKNKDKRTIVNCNKKNASVQKEIDKVKHNAEKTIYVQGICDESVVIDRDNITLRGDLGHDNAVGGSLTQISIDGARRVTINALELTGAGYGVLVTNGAAADIFNNDIHDNVYDGVGVSNSSFARVYYNTITNNGRPDPYWEAGIDV